MIPTYFFCYAHDRGAGLKHDLSVDLLPAIARPDYASVINAIHLQRRHKLSLFDAMILNSAMESDCSILWTEDFSDGQRFGDLVVRNPYKNSRIV